MKKVLCICFVLGLLLSGCAGDSPATNPSASVNGIDEAVYAACLQKAEALSEERNEFVSTGPLLEYDPNRDVYISVANQECDFYPNYSWWKITSLVITKEKISPDQIQVNVPIQTEYTVTVEDLTDFVLAPSFKSAQPYMSLHLDQYMSLQGVDWQKLSRMQLIADIAVELSSQCEGQERQAYLKIASDNQNEVGSVYNTHEEAFKKLTSDDIPQFGAYRVVINFSEEIEPGKVKTTIGSHEETIHNMTYTIAGKQYDVDIGTWRFHKEMPQSLIDASGQPHGLTKKYLQRAMLTGSPYTNGIVNLDKNFHFIAQEDLTITGYHLVGTQIDILGAQVQVGKQAPYFWNMERPIEVAAGEEVIIDVYVYDERFAEHDVYINTTLMMDYEIRGQSYCLRVPNGLLRIDLSVWDSYLMAFCGVDLSAYLAYQGLLQSDWLYNLPEAWLNRN